MHSIMLFGVSAAPAGGSLRHFVDVVMSVGLVVCLVALWIGVAMKVLVIWQDDCYPNPAVNQRLMWGFVGVVLVEFAYVIVGWLT